MSKTRILSRLQLLVTTLFYCVMVDVEIGRGMIFHCLRTLLLLSDLIYRANTFFITFKTFQLCLITFIDLPQLYKHSAVDLRYIIFNKQNTELLCYLIRQKRRTWLREIFIYQTRISWNLSLTIATKFINIQTIFTSFEQYINTNERGNVYLSSCLRLRFRIKQTKINNHLNTT